MRAGIIVKAVIILPDEAMAIAYTAMEFQKFVAEAFLDSVDKNTRLFGGNLVGGMVKVESSD